MTQISQNVETDVLIKIKSKYFKKKNPSQIGMLSHCVSIRTSNQKGFFCK